MSFSFTQQGATPQSSGGFRSPLSMAKKPKVSQSTQLEKPSMFGQRGFSQPQPKQPKAFKKMGGVFNAGSILEAAKNPQGAGGLRLGKPSYQGVFGQSGVPTAPKTQPNILNQSQGSTGGGAGSGQGSVSPFPVPAVAQGPAQGTPQYYANQVTQAGQVTPLEQQYIDQSVKAKNLENYNKVAPYAEAQFYNAGTGQVPDVGAPDLEGRAAGTQGLASNLAGIYSNSALTGLTAANTIAARGLTGATTNLNASLPQLGQPGQVPFSPLNQQQGTILGSQNGGNGLLISGNLAQLPKLQEAYTTMSNNMGSIQGIESLLSNTLGGGQNIADVNVINQAINHLKANTSSAEYNNFKTLLSSLGQLYSGYFAGSGQETDTTRQIGQSLIDGTASASTIKSVLDTLRSEAGVRLNQLHTNIQNIANNPSYLPNPNGGSSNSSSGVWGWDGN